MQTWPDYERSAEKQDGGHPGEDWGGAENRRAYPRSVPEFLTKLKVIRTDFEELRDKRVHRDEWDRLLGDLMRSARISTGRLAGLQELRNQEVGTG